MVSTIKRVSLVFFCVLVVLTSFVFPASAASDFIFNFNIEEPRADEYSGYLIQPFYRRDTSSVNCNIYFWTISPVNTSDSTSVPSVTYSYDFSSNTATILIGTGQQDISYYCSLWVTTPNGNIRLCDSSLISYSSALSFTIKASSNNNSVYSFLTPKFKGNIIADSLPTGSSLTYDYTFSADSVIYSQLVDVIEHFALMLFKADLTNEQLASLVETMNLLLESSYSIDSTLADFVYYYWSQFQYYEFPTQIVAITSRLDSIYKLLSKSGEVEQTTVNSDKVDEFADIEQSLLNNENADNAIGDMDVSIDGQAYSFIWDLITDILNTHPEVFGLVITILTLGFLALILNR